MKIKFMITTLLVCVVFASCTPIQKTPPDAQYQTTRIPFETPPDAKPQITTTSDKAQIEPYQDVRFLNQTNLKSELDRSLIETLWFNETTAWSEQNQKIAQEILALGMNPGLGVRDLHAQGITGKGINVAIIDQNMLLDHPEFQGKIVEYHDMGTNTPDNEGSMHGPAVTSLLVGENIGTAPEANIYYAAVPSWLADAQYYADALDWIIEENEKLPKEDMIHVVSVSAAPSGEGSPFTMNNEAWDAAYKRATDAGILVLDCTTNNGITAPCYYDLDDPDDVTKCTPGWPGVEFQPMPDRIYIPTSLRTTAEEYIKGEIGYQYTGRGGLSWSVPYLSGILAMGWQINPELSGSQIMDILFASAYTRDGGIKIIDPVAFIDMVRSTESE